LKAGTPFEIASVPVRATEPNANARRRRTTDSGSNPVGGGAGDGVGNDALGSWVRIAKPPIAIIATAPTTNA
jgi:hypothetical protein